MARLTPAQKTDLLKALCARDELREADTVSPRVMSKREENGSVRTEVLRLRKPAELPCPSANC